MTVIKNIFYDQLETSIITIHRNDLISVLGDFNAKAGNNNNNIENINGRNGLGLP